MKVFKLTFSVLGALFIAACGAEQEAQAQPMKADAEPISIQPIKVKQAAGIESDLPDDLKTKVLAKFAAFRPDLAFRSVNATAFPGLYEAEFEQGGVVYISESGEFFISGEIFKIETTGVVNISEEGRVKRRQSIVKNLNPADLVTFPAEGEDVTDIYVFTDVHCGYCAKLHNDVDQLAKAGIRVNYLAYPRGGPASQVYGIMQSVWCSKDRQTAMTDAKAGKQIPPVQCSSSAVIEQYEMGNRAGVRGTPAIMFSDGSLEPGYRPPHILAAMAKSKR